MNIKPGELEPNEFAFHFETNDAVHPQALGTFLRELERIAHLRRHFGPDAEVRLVDIGTGSVWGRIAIAAGTLAGLGSFALALEQRLNSPTDPLAQAVAAMSLDSSVVSATIVTRDRVITVRTADMPAVPLVALKRANGGQLPARGGGHLADRTAGDAYKERMIDLPLHGRINHGDTPRNRMLDDDSLASGPAPITFAATDKPALPAPMAARGGLRFGGSGDLRASRYYVGQIHPPGPLEFRPSFAMTKGGEYWIERADSVEEDDLAYGMPVVVRAEIDEESHTMLVFEVIILSQA
jgi:hypothetical protein